MARPKTNRTEGIFIKVTPEIKKDIERRQKIGLNLSSWFCTEYEDTFMTKEKILDKIGKLRDELGMYEFALADLNKEEARVKKLTLKGKELMELKDAIEKFRREEDQFSIFKMVTKREELSIDEFRKLKVKYIA